MLCTATTLTSLNERSNGFLNYSRTSTILQLNLGRFRPIRVEWHKIFVFLKWFFFHCYNRISRNIFLLTTFVQLKIVKHAIRINSNWISIRKSINYVDNMMVLDVSQSLTKVRIFDIKINAVQTKQFLVVRNIEYIRLTATRNCFKNFHCKKSKLLWTISVFSSVVHCKFSFKNN